MVGLYAKCRKKWTSEKVIKKFLLDNSNKSYEVSSSLHRTLRSDTSFSIHRDCLFCGEEVKRCSNAWPFSLATTESKDTLRSICHQRNDDWAKQVLGRIESVCDLQAADASYHRACSQNFRGSRKRPSTSTETDHKFQPAKKSRIGRKITQDDECAFLNTLEYLKKKWR